MGELTDNHRASSTWWWTDSTRLIIAFPRRRCSAYRLLALAENPFRKSDEGHGQKAPYRVQLIAQLWEVA